MNEEPLDTLVLGGGAAGLSGALTLARSRRSVLVLDAGEPRNAPAAGVHAFLTRDGLPPAELGRLGRAEVESYGGRVRPGTAVAAQRVGDLFAVDTADGETLHARRLLVATGLVDELPDLPGVRELWGRDVLHCPYCHGWEVRDQPLAVLGTGPGSLHQVKLFRQLTADLVYLRHHAPELTAEEAEELAALGVPVVDEEVTGLEITDDRLSGVRLASGRVAAPDRAGPRAALRRAQRRAGGPGRPGRRPPLGRALRPARRRHGAHHRARRLGRGQRRRPVRPGRRRRGRRHAAGARINADLVVEDTARAVARHREGAA